MKTASTTFLPVLATMLLSVCITLSARADRAENAFVKVRAVGSGVTRVDGRNFTASEDGEVEIEAQPGWRLLTPSRVRVTKGQSPRYRVRNASNEDEGEGDVWRTVVEVVTNHLTDPVVVASVSAGGPCVYALPNDGADAAATFAASATKLGTHEIETRTTTYHNGAVVDESIEKSEPFTVEIDRWSWKWTFDDSGTTNLQTFATPVQHLTNGNHGATGSVEGRASHCAACSGTATASTNVIVSLLKVSCNPWIGQDRTGDPSASYTSPKVTATASLDPANPDVKKVTWGGVNKCEKREPKDWSITLWTKNRDLASDTYLGEKVTATVAGVTASTNFTIVKVDVALNNVRESEEETAGPWTIVPAVAIADIVGPPTSAFPQATLSVTPNDLPSSEKLSVSCLGGTTLCEILGRGAFSTFSPVVPAFFSASELSGRTFAIVPQSASSGSNGQTISIFHTSSGAQDKAALTSVQFDFTAVSENGNGVIGELTDNRVADVEIIPSPSPVDSAAFSYAFNAIPKEIGSVINKMGTNVSFTKTANPLIWKTSPVYWYGIAPDKECHTFHYAYQFTLFANEVPVKIRDYPVGWPFESPAFDPGRFPVAADTTSYAAPATEITIGGTKWWRSELIFSGFAKNPGILINLPATDQYAAETEKEERYHMKQWRGEVSTDEGGQGDCFTERGLIYFAKLQEPTLAGPPYYVYGTTKDDAETRAIEILYNAIDDELSTSKSIHFSDRGFRELKAKEHANYNAAWRYHCTYESTLGTSPTNYPHPAYQQQP